MTYPYTDAGVAQAIAALGTTENAVATNLYALGFRGIPGSEAQDPPGRYLLASIEGAAYVEVIVEVGGRGEAYAIVSSPDREDVSADLPPHVVAFIQRFDAGKHPELIEAGSHGA